jgi:hypothetical protein
MMKRSGLFFGLLLVMIAGCNPGVRVVKNPGDGDEGIRYYRPKPYLFLAPSGSTKLDDKGKPTEVSPSDQFVSIELRYLPDFTEEYSINVTPGLGTATVNIGLQDGWNLTSINQTLDSNFDDNVKAVAELTKAVGGLVGTATDSAKAGDSTILADNVSARNVPLGFYEAVIGRDNCGRKQMYGWRYIGFTPFAQCPIYPSGQDTACCNNGTLELFGLVFENGVMVFRPLHQVQQIPDELSSYVPVKKPQPGDEKDKTEVLRAQIEKALKSNADINDKNLKILKLQINENQIVYEVETIASESNVNKAIAEFALSNPSPLLGNKPTKVVLKMPAIAIPNVQHSASRAGRAILSSTH